MAAMRILSSLPRRTGRWTLGMPALLLALAAGAVSAAAPQSVGIAAAVINDVRIKAIAAGQFARAAVRQPVRLTDQVQTGGNSRLQLLLLDKSKFTVGANARLTIDRFVYDPSGGSMTASVAKGAFRFMSGKSGGTKSITSPAASIGIRGTLLDGVVGETAVAIARGERDIRGNVRSDPATATLVVLRGPGPNTQGKVSVGAVDVTAGGKTVTLDRPLLAAYVPYAGAEPIGPFSLSNSGVARLNDLLLEPREIRDNPDGPGQPYMPQAQPERPYYNDYPPPGLDDDSGPGPSRPGSYVPSFPGAGDLPRGTGGRPGRQGRGAPQAQPTQTPTTTVSPNGSTAPTNNRLTLPQSSPQSATPPTTSTVPSGRTDPNGTTSLQRPISSRTDRTPPATSTTPDYPSSNGASSAPIAQAYPSDTVPVTQAYPADPAGPTTQSRANPSGALRPVRTPARLPGNPAIVTPNQSTDPADLPIVK